jgi:hypothetical protein
MPDRCQSRWPELSITAAEFMRTRVSFGRAGVVTARGHLHYRLASSRRSGDHSEVRLGAPGEADIATSQRSTVLDRSEIPLSALAARAYSVISE